jgi:hypothetical protein
MKVIFIKKQILASLVASVLLMNSLIMVNPTAANASTTVIQAFLPIAQSTLTAPAAAIDTRLILGSPVVPVTDTKYYYNSSTYKYIYPSSAFHSPLHQKVYNYMLNTDNQVSVYNQAVALHNGITINNCAYFVSELLRRNDVNIPTDVSMVTQVQRQLSSRGFKTDTNLKNLKSGDICFTKSNTHVFTFMGWVNSDKYDYAYVVDNQARLFDGQVYHVRRLDGYDASHDTDQTALFMYSIK